MNATDLSALLTQFGSSSGMTTQEMSGLLTQLGALYNTAASAPGVASTVGSVTGTPAAASTGSGAGAPLPPALRSSDVSLEARNYLSQLFNLSGAAPVPGQAVVTQDMLDSYRNMGKITTQLAQMVYDNSWINDTLTSEGKRVVDLSQDSRKGIYKARQLSLAEAYSAHYYRFVTNIIVFTAFVTMACLLVVGTWRANVLTSTTAAGVLVAAILLVYTLALVYLFTTIKLRTKSDWDQYYFQPSSELVKESELRPQGRPA